MTDVVDRGRIALYGAAGVAVAAFVSSTLLMSRGGEVSLAAAFVPSLVLGMLAIAAQYPCRALPLRTARPSRIVLTHAISAAAASGGWTLVWRSWTPAVAPRAHVDVPLLSGLGVLLYLMSVALHYLLSEVQAAREAEKTALRYELLAREAELKAFKAQVDPHFLYNSLNAVASLCGSRPQDARQMSQLLADFFRATLRLGGNERVTLAQEIDLVSRYLAIEKVRFGERLGVDVVVDADVESTVVPPLILQPLVENAVRHGISSMIDGGVVRIAARRSDGVVRITVTNPADPDRAHGAGEGIGLQNVRGRLNVLFGASAALRAEEAGGEYRVVMELPR